MKKRFYSLLLLTILVLGAHAKSNDDVRVVESMLKRLIPAYADRFEFKKTEGAKDFFRIESIRKSKILISGNNANSMAVGLNYYLKYHCLTTVSWYANQTVEMPDTLPVITTPVEIPAKVERRFFLNYCTFGYTMPFWKWTDWERFIDWMALNGINMPLAITGQEAVWYKVWKEMGLKDKEILSYFTGPVYLPWHRMANIDSWNGPLPMEWLENQVDLQKKILSRERELNMKPVLPAFNGHVPAALKQIYPDANVQSLGKWAGFAKQYHCSFLNPEEPLFALIQKKFLKEQTRLFGTDHVYGVDPFNEVDPPSWEPEYLGKVSSKLYHTLTEADPKAEWLQMTWMFYFDRKKWTAPRVEALLKGVPTDKMFLLDYHCENVELWKNTQRFHGQPFIWCYLGNFGGNTAITGNVKEGGRRLEVALQEGGEGLKGIGSTLEGLDVDQFPYEYILEKAWDTNIKDKEWIDALADRHVGSVSLPVRDAWQRLFNDVYVQVPKTAGILPTYRPKMGENSGRTKISYTNRQLLTVWKNLLEVPDLSRNALRLDVISVGRQLIGNYFLEVKNEFDSLYKAKDLPAMKMRAAEMREILADVDKLTSYHDYTALSKWISDARALSNDPSIQDYYEKNARNLVTTWGGTLNDYASRAWSGLIRDYYAVRWNLYMDAVLQAVESKSEFNQSKLDEAFKQFEESWVASRKPVDCKAEGDLLEYARILLHKYESRLAKKTPMVFVIGDSTVKYRSGNGEFGRWGWGGFLQTFFDASRIAVENAAVEGRSSRTYYTEGLWGKLLPDMQKGDYLLIDFGHNDSGPIDTGLARGALKGIGDESKKVVLERDGSVEEVFSYGHYIRRYICQAKEKGVEVIILSHTPANQWQDGRMRRCSQTYAKWSKEVAEQENVYFVDLNDLAARKYESLGEKKTKPYFFDMVHTSREGAVIHAEAVIEGIRSLDGCCLKKYLKE